MSQNECEQLEAYLSDDLSATEAGRFTDHLAHCPTCSAMVDQQHWLDRLLSEAAATHSAPAMVELAIDRAIVRTRRRRLLSYGCTAAAAAALLLMFVMPSPPQPDQPAPQVAAVSQPDQPAAPVATFVGSDDMIVIQHESPYPNVTIVEVYPVFHPQKTWQHDTSPKQPSTHQSIPGDST